MTSRRIAIALLLLATSLATASAAAAEARLVILVRHAETESDGTRDPALSAAGKERARALAQALRGAKVGTILVSEFARTRDTAGALAEALGVTPRVAPAAGGLEGHVRAVVELVRGAPEGGAILVVGHSNTIPAIAAALGAPAPPAIAESEHGTMLVLLVPAQGAASMVTARY